MEMLKKAAAGAAVGGVIGGYRAIKKRRTMPIPMPSNIKSWSGGAISEMEKKHLKEALDNYRKNKKVVKPTPL
jgi:hypothetical protein